MDPHADSHSAPGVGGGNGYDQRSLHDHAPPQQQHHQQHHQSRDQPDDDASSPDSRPPSPSSKPRGRREKSEREKRTYRACLHCRQRKSRCDLYSSGEPGRPPCERCIREQHECVLGGSRRGGRRVKRAPSDVIAGGPSNIPVSTPQTHLSSHSHSQPSSHLPQVPSIDSVLHPSLQHQRTLPSWSTLDPASRTLPPLSHDGTPINSSTAHLNPNRHSSLGSTSAPRPSSPTAHNKMTVDDSVASTDLQNPADALEFLASVAERDGNGKGGRSRLPSMQVGAPGGPHARSLLNPSPSEGMRGIATSVEGKGENGGQAGAGRRVGEQRSASAAAVGAAGDGDTLTAAGPETAEFPPLQQGLLSLDMIQALLYRYEEKYHPFFPLANPAAMDPENLPTIAQKEPHLLAAILTVASKDEKDWWQVHEVCSGHMQSLVASLVYGGRGSVEAVEAMLILAEWVPRRPHQRPAIGRGEEDQAAWMYVGTAIRLGYLLGIDRTGFRAESEAQSADLNRKRLAWASCYMSDRQISVRIGKAFWSRGPGPMTALRAQDFPSLHPRLHRQDDFAAIFQANLELTQLFSNAHDVLYATKGRSNQLNFGGEYVKYIDDFRVALRHWNESWGTFTCSPPLKASLILSYEYLRLYINAFAYQATLNRLISRMKEFAQTSRSDPSSTTNRKTAPAYPFADVAATPDARFIYDAIDAAKALLSTFCSFVDPQDTFRFMPLRYYLYVIYSAVFLYKARSTGVMAADNRGSVKRLISDTMDNLQKSSAAPNDVGERYSRLIRLLWRKAPGHRGSVVADPSEITRPGTAMNGMLQPDASGQPSQQHGQQPHYPHHQQSHHHAASSEPNQSPYPHNHNQQQYPPYQQQPPYASPLNPSAHQPPPPAHSLGPSINQFSWLDLPAVGDFAVENNGSLAGSISLENLDGFAEDSSADGFSGAFDPGFVVGPGMFGWGGGQEGMVDNMGGGHGGIMGQGEGIIF